MIQIETLALAKTESWRTGGHTRIVDANLGGLAGRNALRTQHFDHAIGLNCIARGVVTCIPARFLGSIGIRGIGCGIGLSIGFLGIGLTVEPRIRSGFIIRARPSSDDNCTKSEHSKS